MAKSCLQVAPCRHLKSKQAARDVDHVAVLDILWSYWLTVNGRPKVNGLAALFSVDYASQMNIADASIVTYSARLHNRLVHGRWPIKTYVPGLLANPDMITVAGPFSNVTSTSLLSSCPS